MFIIRGQNEYYYRGKINIFRGQNNFKRGIKIV